MNRTQRIIPRAGMSLLWLAASVFLFGCHPDAPTAVPPAVECVSLEAQDVPVYQEWVGTLDGDINASISAQVSGYLIRRDYTEGRRVTNGQVLFQIEPGPFKAALAQAEAQLAQARAQKGKTELDVKRYKPLAVLEAISQQELDDAIQSDHAAAAQVASAEATVQAAQLNLSFTTIVSPVDGVAGLAQAQIGNLVGPASGLLTTVTKMDPMRVNFSVSQQSMTLYQEYLLASGRRLHEQHNGDSGMPLQLTLASGEIYSQTGRVRYADNQVDARTGTVRVVGEFPNPQGLLVPGMFTRVRGLVHVETNALVAPQMAILNLQGRCFVAVVGADDKVALRPVTVGTQMGEQCVVTGPVKAGDRVVTEGVQKVRDGMTVKPVPPEAKP
jgi:RND family efflux transporter MFP subunit